MAQLLRIPTPVTAALLPLRVVESRRGRVVARGSDEQARSTPILAQRGLPGDPGLNKTRYRFISQDQRLIEVFRAVYKAGPLVHVRVGPTPDEQAAIAAEEAREQLESAAEWRVCTTRLAELTRLIGAHAQRTPVACRPELRLVRPAPR